MAGTTLRPSVDAQPLITLKRGAPHVHVSNVYLLGVITVEGGELTLDGCHFDGDSVSGRRLQALAAAGRALLVSGGIVRVFGGSFSNLKGGAIGVTGGELDLHGTTLEDNRATAGGALLVTGGTVRVARALFRGNVGVASGGALQVEGGEMELAQSTLLVDNEAPRGSAL